MKTVPEMQPLSIPSYHLSVFLLNKQVTVALSSLLYTCVLHYDDVRLQEICEYILLIVGRSYAFDTQNNSRIILSSIQEECKKEHPY